MSEVAKAAAVVAAFNEGGTVGDVVRALKGSSLVSEVVVVDDGSTDGTGEAARRAGADKVVVHERTRGKGGAMASGVGATDAEIISFWDADLLRLTPEHVASLVAPVLDEGHEMCVGLVDRGPINLLNSRLPLISGQRTVRRRLFERVSAERLDGYGADLAISLACEAGPTPKPIVLKGVGHINKFRKHGLLGGLRGYARMFGDIISVYGHR